jgi:hypothetical protein
LESAYPNIFRTPKRRPLHVINITLNLVRGKNLAWQNRQAESFTVSSLHSGSYQLGYRRSDVYGRTKQNRAITLGTAAAISGAAVSPNMGYYSSTFITFLLALFNLRLGWWLGNPGLAGSRRRFTTYDKAGPAFAVRPLVDETLGLTDDEHPYVYLSDGGHFENLGLYEMVLRRCKRIVISDGSADPDFGFDGLGNAISKIRVDLGVPLEIDNIYMLPRDKEDEMKQRFGQVSPRFENRYCAIGTIRYSCVDGVGSQDDAAKYDGKFIYIKPFLSGREPVDVYNYAKTHDSFPHESTADQWYSESQFKSYRVLGSYLMDRILEPLQEATLEDLFKSIQ